LNFFFQICERNFDLRNLKINFCASDIKAIFNRLDINKDAKIHYWELKNFFKFRDYSKISGLEDIEYRPGPSQYAYQPPKKFNKANNLNNDNNNNNDKGLLEYKYPNRSNINTNYKNNNGNQNNLNENSLNNIRSPYRNSNCLNFNDIHNEIEDKIGSINKLIQHDKSKQNQLDNQVRFITEADNVRSLIKNEIGKINNPNSKHYEFKELDINNNESKQDTNQIKTGYDSNLTRKYLSNSNNNNQANNNNDIQNNNNHNNNNNIAYSQNNSRKASGNFESSKFLDQKNPTEPKTNLSLLTAEKHNKSRQFSNSKFGFSTLEEIKTNNTQGIKLNLEEEIFLQFLIDILNLNKETEAIKNELARRFDFSILKLFKIFQEAEDENDVFLEEKVFFKPNFVSPIGEYRERSNYPNTFNITNKFNNTNKSFSSYNNLSEDKQRQNQSFNLSYIKSFPIGTKSKENIISKFAFKKTLNAMEIYPTLIELKLILNRFNNKEADFR